eukprot:11186383-Lingulodinium_polyedra.AAC.1
MAPLKSRQRTRQRPAVRPMTRWPPPALARSTPHDQQELDREGELHDANVQTLAELGQLLVRQVEPIAGHRP